MDTNTLNEDNLKKGLLGEENICDLINKNIDIYSKIIRNVYIPIENKKTEIDIILITSFGLFIIESKNYSGYIYGSEEDYQWTQYFTDTNKNYFLNPIHQNEYHIDYISNYLKRDLSYFKSYIIFGENAKLAKINYDKNKNKNKVLYLADLIENLIEDMHNSEIILSHEDIDKIYIDLKYYCEHIHN